MVSKASRNFKSCIKEVNRERSNGVEDTPSFLSGVDRNKLIPRSYMTLKSYRQLKRKLDHICKIMRKVIKL